MDWTDKWIKVVESADGGKSGEEVGTRNISSGAEGQGEKKG